MSAIATNPLFSPPLERGPPPLHFLSLAGIVRCTTRACLLLWLWRGVRMNAPSKKQQKGLRSGTHTNGGGALCVALTAARLSVKKKEKRSRATYFGGTHSTSYMLFAPVCCILHLSADSRHCLSCQKKEEASTIEWGVQQLCILLVRTCRRLPKVWAACIARILFHRMCRQNCSLFPFSPLVPSGVHIWEVDIEAE